MMVEVPSAALLADRFAPWVDFFSLGTNDLAQYTMAADRTNAAVAALADGLEPAVLRLIQMTADAGAAAGKWVGVCGELAGDTAAVPVLIGLGVVELSMNPQAITAVKAEIRRWTIADARDVARRALALDSARAVRALLADAGARSGR
jgi:phosphoenolpyruvate-protein kinase (PTS system EI component)